MRIIKRTICILSVSLLCITAVGCSKADPPKKTRDSMIVDVKETLEKYLEINIHKDFSDKSYGEIYITEPVLYPCDDITWVENIASRYFYADKIDLLKKEQIEKNTFIKIEEGSEYFYASSSLISFYKDPSFKENACLYYREPGIDRFFTSEIDLYFSEQDLDFLSYEEARKMSDDFMEDIGFHFYRPGCEGYAFDAPGLNKYKESHQGDINQMKSVFEEVLGIDFISKWTEKDEFYVFYYPSEINGLQLLSGEVYPAPWAEVVINKDGIAVADAPYSFEIVQTGKETIITPLEALEKVKEMYLNTITAQKIKIYDLDLQYMFTEYIKETEQYRCSPVWKFYVEMRNEDGSFVTSSVTYDAITGERLY